MAILARHSSASLAKDASGIAVMPTTSMPMFKNIFISALLSNLGPSTHTYVPDFFDSTPDFLPACKRAFLNSGQ
jgi:hypothetical protein